MNKNTNNIKNIITVALYAFVLFGLTFICWFGPAKAYSDSERRELSKFAKPTAETLKNGKFMSSFEDYTLDQFPARDTFRSVKAVASKYVFGQKDNHGLYTVNGYLSKLEYPMSMDRININISKLNEISDKFLAGTSCKTYLSIIPDKNCFMAPLGNYPSVDYPNMIETIKNGVKHDTFIDIFDLLALEDYYCTDQHWRQEKVEDVAESILSSMCGTGIIADIPEYTVNTLDNEFRGAYVGQSALSFKGDTVNYLTNAITDGCSVTSFNTGKGKPAFMYDMDKAHGKDPYEMFLSGSDALLVVENPACTTGKELVVFRDSFGSSLIPLLTPGYSKITVVDLRYIASAAIPMFVEFDSQDVLYLYSTLIFNNTISK